MCPVSVGMAGVPAVEVWIVCAREVVKRRGKGRLRPEYEVFWFFFLIVPFIFFYYYFVTVVPIFLPLPCCAQPTPRSHSQSLHRCPCPWVIHTCFLTDTFPSFHHYSFPLSPLAVVSLFPVSMSLVIFCLLVNFFH